MEYKIQKLYDQVNQAIIRCRGVYSMWAKNNNVSYNRMLVLYTISEMKKDGILVTDPEKSTGKEKALVLTPEGERYSEKLLYSLSRMEERAAKRLGEDKIRRMTELFMEYDQILEEALEETDDEE